MLCQFSFKNFKSYKEDTVFDFRATSISEFEDSLILKEGADPLLPVCVVYGPNGGGKTNLLAALSCLITTVSKPIYDLGKTRVKSVIQERVSCSPYMLDTESKDKPTIFEVFFRAGMSEYKYDLSLFGEEVISEALYWRAIGGRKTGTVFERNGLEVELGQSINKTSINRAVNPKMPYLSFLAINYDIPVIAEVQRWFESCIIMNYGNVNFERNAFWVENSEIRHNVVRVLNNMDIDLDEYFIDEEKKRIITRRKVDGQTYELFFEDESAGTRKLISMLPLVLLALKEGRLVIVDELDSKLHPKLLKYVISLFKNKNINTKGAQIMFTSHDLSTMKNSVFRRDEIWFASENQKHQSCIYSLYDIRNEDNDRIKSTAAYDKQYLEGRYGADPYLSNMLSEGWNNEP